jgi:hypothetical protein
VQPTTGFHQHIMHMFSPEPQLVFDNAITFHTTYDMFDTYTYPIDTSIFLLFFRCQLSSAWLFLRLPDDDACYRKALKSHVLIEDTLRRKYVRFIISQTFIVPFSFIRCTETTNETSIVNDENILYSMMFLLATIVQPLVIGVIWPIYWSFRAVMTEKREMSVTSVS